MTKPVLAAIACSGILITSIYILRLLKRVFFGELNPQLANMSDAKTTEWVALVLTGAVIIIIGVWPAPMVAVISSAVQPVVHLLGALH